MAYIHDRSRKHFGVYTFSITERFCVRSDMRTPDVVGNMYWSEKLIRGVQNQVMYLVPFGDLYTPWLTAVVGNSLILIALHTLRFINLPKHCFGIWLQLFLQWWLLVKTPRIFSILPPTLDLHKLRMVVSFLVCIISRNWLSDLLFSIYSLSRPTLVYSVIRFLISKSNHHGKNICLGGHLNWSGEFKAIVLTGLFGD